MLCRTRLGNHLHEFTRFLCRWKSVVVGLSGGVDSAVSALLLKQQGYDVTGIFMRNWSVEEETGNPICPAKDDELDARKIAQTIGIPFEVVHFEKEYWNDVFAICLQAYERGETPNPDILCNRHVKFNAFSSYCFHAGYDYIATGHYARIHSTPPPYSRFTPEGACELLKGTDPKKDQSYFLSEVQSEVLSRTLFPIGELPKSRVKEIAKQAGLHVFNKKESMGICFIGERNMRNFLSNYLQPRPGKIRSLSGIILGEHDGLAHYTIGQGVKLSNSRVRLFVCQKHVADNSLVVCEKNDPALFHTSFLIRCNDLCWVNSASQSLLLDYCLHHPHDYPIQCQLRYKTDVYPCRLHMEGDQLRVSSYSSMRAITPGQVCVFYDDSVCLGGGRIDAV